MVGDVELLRAYARGHSEVAFTELVRRHVGLVYSVALRRVGGDTHLAEDVTQMVFRDLALKSKRLLGRSSLSGWLYMSAQFASAEVARKEHRRKIREEVAGAAGEIGTPATIKADWGQARALLDEAMARLKTIDREAVVLRYFEKRSYAEIGLALRLSEDAARKRVDRALEKLRAGLNKSGFASGCAAITEMLGEEATAAVSAPLPAKVAATAVAEFAAASAGTSLLLSWLGAVNLGTVAVTATFLGLGSLLAWQHTGNARMRAEIARLGEHSTEIRALGRDNQRIARLVSDARAKPPSRSLVLRIRPQTLSGGSLSAVTPAATVNVTVASDGTIHWEGEPITLAEFLERLSFYRSQNPDPSAQVVVHGEAGAPFGATAYVVEQASKAEILNIVVDNPAAPMAAINWISVPPQVPGVANVPPPTLPDLPPKT